MALQATLRKQQCVATFVLVRIVASGAGHFRVLKARAFLEPRQLVAGVYAANLVRGRFVSMVLGQVVARSE